MKPPSMNDQGSYFVVWMAAHFLKYALSVHDKFLELSSGGITKWCNSYNEKQLTIVGTEPHQISYYTLE